MSLWWTWVRRSYAPFFLPFGVGIALALWLSESTHEFRFEWQWASAESGTWLFFAGAIIAGTSAWEAWLTRQRGETLTAGSRSPHAGRLSVFTGAVTWWLALHVLIVAAHLVAAALSEAIGEAAVLHLLAQFSAVAGYCGLGVAVGWWIRSPLAAPVLAALILLSVPEPIPGISLRGLTWFGSAASLVGLRFEPLSLMLKLCFFAGLVLLGIAVPRQILAGRVLTALGCMVAIAAAVPAVMPRADLEGVPIAHHTCRSVSEIVVCGPPELEAILGTTGHEVAPVVADLQRLGVDPPTKFRVHGRGGPVVPEPGVGWLSVSKAPRHGEVEIPRHVLVEAVTVPTSCGDPSEDRWVETMVVREAVYGWVLSRWGIETSGGQPLYSPDLISDLHGVSAAAQRDWFVETYTALWRCEEAGLRLPDGVSHPSVGAADE